MDLIPAPIRQIAATPTTLPSPSPTPDAAGFFPQCYAVVGWQAATMQTNGTDSVRTLWPVEPQAAPDFSAADVVLAYGDIAALGYCAPGDAPAQRAATAARVTFWAFSAGRLLPWPAHLVDQYLADRGEVYLAPVWSRPGEAGSWTPGRYAFRVPLSAPSSSGPPLWGWLPIVIIGQ